MGRRSLLLLAGCLSACTPSPGSPGGPDLPGATGAGGWGPLGEADFMNVNGLPETWVWRDDGTLAGSGLPIGVMCTRETVEDFELEVEWRHLRAGGNSGVFVWVPPEALQGLPPGELPEGGIEVQILDHGYRDQYEARTGRVGDWFTTHGDVFAVGESTLRPFPPLSPDGSRSFPRQELSRGSPEWNHYRVRAVDGEVRLWVNGGEVSGGSEAQPRVGHLCVEAEGSPVEFRKLRFKNLGVRL